MDLGAVDAGANELAGRARAPRSVCSCQVAISGSGVPTANVRVMSEKQRALDVVREEVADEVVVVRDAAGARVVPVRRLRAVRDDQVVAAAAVRGERRPWRPPGGARR